MDDPTRPSLLLRLRDPSDREAWARFEELYAPLLYRYARARGLRHDDAEDVRSTCYEQIVRGIGEFDYDRSRGSFKGWLRTLVDRRVVDLLRKRRDRLAESHELREAPGREPEAPEAWELEWKRRHLEFCLEAIRPEVRPEQFEAFRLVVIEGFAVPEVSARTGLNANQIYKAKGRILGLVRARMQDLGTD